ncbi:MAG: hypothetical protein ABW321_07290 [Polyangiales bacterium]
MLALAGAGTVAYVRVVHRVYAVEKWLVWRMLAIWAAVLVFSLACTAIGQWVIRRGLKHEIRPPLEAAVFAMAVGVVTFALAMYVGGALHWFGPTFAIALPLGCLAIGGRELWRLGGLLAEEVRAARRRSFFTIASTALGGLCVAVIYLGAMTPDALNYDSTWYHLVIAQDYARAGGFVPFPADYNKNYPQLTGLISTWAWSLPYFSVPLRWMLSLHLECSLFLWTLASVSAGIRRLSGHHDVRGAWATFFLFPIIFVYDHNLGGAADHICAFFSVPIVLATVRLCRTFSRADAVLLAFSCAGSLLSKYQAAYVIAPVGLVIAVHWLLELTRTRRSPARGLPVERLVAAPLIAAGLFLLLVSPHFIKQWVFHHNPVYPFLQPVFKASWPVVPDGAMIFERTAQEPAWRPAGSLLDKLWHASKLFVSFSFHPHYSFNNNVPVFGSLFTLLLPALLVVRARWATAIAAVICSVALLIWGMVYNVDRNIQVFMPVMVCVTGSLLVQTWQLGSWARLGLAPLVLLQLFWGADAVIYSEYGRIQSAFELMRSGYEGRADVRFDHYRQNYRAVDKALPKHARVLLHTSHLSLGIDREVYFDWAGYQGLIAYGHLHTPAELFRYYRSLGITHLLQTPDVRPAASKQEEVLWNALLPLCKSVGRFGEFRLFALPKKAPADEAPYTIGTIGLPGYGSGVFPITDLGTDEYLPGAAQHYKQPPTPLPLEREARAAALSQVDAVVVVDREVSAAERGGWTSGFKRGQKLPGGFTLYLKSH